MNKIQLENFNKVVTAEDEVYILGDLMLGDAAVGQGLVSQLNGNLHIILGNHDTNSRIEFYKQLPQVKEVVYATLFKKGKHNFYLSHYPTLVGNCGETHGPVCLHGHTHSKDKFEFFEKKCYNVNIDAHLGYPILFDQIVQDLKEENKNRKEDM